MLDALLEKAYELGRGAVISTQALSKMFAPLDINFLRNKLRVSERGRENGSKNIPSPDAKDLDSVESEIFAAGQDALRQYLDEYETQIEAYQARIESYRKLLQEFSITNELMKAIGDMKSKIAEKKTTLYEKQESIKALSNTIISFRRSAGLLHRTPKLKSPKWTLAKITAAGLVEIVLTAALIREAGDAFAILSIAFVFFLLNIVMVTYLLARGVRFINLRIDGRRYVAAAAFGSFLFCIYLGYALTINLAFAHLRSVSSQVELLLQQNPGEYLAIFNNLGSAAMKNFLEDGFSLPNPESYALFLLGLGLSAFAFIQGYTYNDVYPSYGSYKRAFDEEFEDFVEAMEDVIDEFKDTRDEGISEVEKIAEELRTSYDRIPLIRSNAESLKDRFLQAIDNTNTDIRTLIQEYRERNLSERSLPAPKYFYTVPSLSVPSLYTLSRRDVKSPDQIIKQIQRHRDVVFEIFDMAIKEVRDLRRVLDSEYPFYVRKEG